MGKPYNEMGRYGGVGIELIVAMLLLGWVGHWLDGRYFGGGDYGMFIGGILGVAVGVRNLVQATRRLKKDLEADEAKDPAGNRWTVDETWLHKPDDDDGTPPRDKPS